MNIINDNTFNLHNSPLDNDNRYMKVWRCPWCNGYRRRKWTRRLEFMDENDCISHSTNTLGNGMNPIILPPAMGK